jgi:hypothetical protein
MDRASVQTRMDWAQVTRNRARNRASFARSKNARTPITIGISTLARSIPGYREGEEKWQTFDAMA